MMMPQVLDTRRPTNNYKVANNSEDDNTTSTDEDLVLNNCHESVEDVPVFQYCGDAAFEQYMRRDYENCELRSFVVAFPHHD